MRKLLNRKTLAVAAVLALLAWRAPLFSRDPGPLLLHAFSAAGFSQVSLPEPVKKRGVLVYSDIRLDPDGFSTIQKLEIEHGLNGKIQAVRIEGLSLTGELQEGLRITMAGWEKPSSGDLRSLALSIPADAPVSFKDTQIELLSESVGGIELSFDLETIPGDEGREILARLKGAQQQLSYDANVTGLMTPEGMWQINAEVEQAKFDLGHLKSTRISGLIGITGEKFQSSDVIGNLQAGGLTLLALPWQNVAITLEGSLEKTRMIIGAKSAGVEGVELGLTLGDIQNPGTYAGSLHCDSAGDLLRYLQSNGALPFASLPSGGPAEARSLDTEFRGNAQTAIFDFPGPDGTPASSFLIRSARKGSGLSAIPGGAPFIYERRDGSNAPAATLAYLPDENRVAGVPDKRTFTLDLQALALKPNK